MNWDFYAAMSDLEVTERRSMSNRHMDITLVVKRKKEKEKKKEAKSLM